MLSEVTPELEKNLVLAQNGGGMIEGDETTFSVFISSYSEPNRKRVYYRVRNYAERRVCVYTPEFAPFFGRRSIEASPKSVKYVAVEANSGTVEKKNVT